MEKILLVAFRIDIFKFNPSKTLELLRPDNLKNSKFIPQTLGDQVWIWFEFHTTEEKELYIDWVKENHRELSDCFMHDEEFMTQEEIDHWV